MATLINWCLDDRILDDTRIGGFRLFLKIGSKWKHNQHTRCVAVIEEIRGDWIVYSLSGNRRKETFFTAFARAFQPLKP